MLGQQINRVSLIALVVLSLIALLCVVSGFFQPPQPQTDEGAAAHIFQLSIVAFVPTTLLFLATADWSHPLRSARTLAFPLITVMVACGVLYYLEHFVEHVRY
jgi:amino acid transporter